jgi:hypothetical protein
MNNILQTETEIDIDKQYIITLFNTYVKGVEICLDGKNLNHCGKNLSDKCMQYFKQDLCFYECEPSVGLWVQKVDRKFANERIFKVPLCASECDSWFDACKDDVVLPLLLVLLFTLLLFTLLLIVFLLFIFINIFKFLFLY